MAATRVDSEVSELATDAISKSETRAVLRAVSGEDPTDEAVRSLHRTMAEETADMVSRSSRRARRRDRYVDGGDIGHVADRRYPSPGRTREMTHPDVREAALRAVDEEEVRTMFRAASGEDPTGAAVEGLRETIANELMEIALRADGHARRRGRSLEADDIGRTIDERYAERYRPMVNSYYRD